MVWKSLQLPITRVYRFGKMMNEKNSSCLCSRDGWCIRSTGVDRQKWEMRECSVAGNMCTSGTHVSTENSPACAQESDVSEKLQPSLDLDNVSLVFRIDSHLIFDGLIGMNNRAVVTAAKVKADRLE
jgi:hypothetical protein